MAETIRGQNYQLYAIHERDAFHVEGTELVLESTVDPKPKPKKGATAKARADRKDPPLDLWDRAALLHLVRGLVRESVNRECFLRALRGDHALAGRALGDEDLANLIVQRLHSGELRIVPYTPDEDEGGGSAPTLPKLEIKSEPPPPKEKVCKLEHATIECSHDYKGKPRKPKDGVLCVVPAEAGDTIKLEGDWEGGCGDHPVWKVGGFWTTTEKKATTSFKARPWFVGHPGATMMLRWLSGVAPKQYDITATGCEGTKKFTVKSYPADKLTVTLKGEKWEAVQERIDHFINTYLCKVLRSPKFEILKGSAAVSAQWTEWTDHRAYYKWEASVGMNPLIAAKIRVPFGPTAAIPQWMKDLVHCEAGFFVEFAGGININGKWSRATPEKAKMYAEANGFVYGKIGAELKLVSKKICAIEVAGKSGFGITASPDYKAEKPTLLLELKWEGVKGLVTATAAWGWIEIEHEFNIVDEKTIWEKRPFELVKENAS